MSRYIEWKWYQRQVKKMHEQHPDVYMPTDGIPIADVRENIKGEWEEMFNTKRYVLVTTTYNDQGVIIDTKAEDITGGKWIAIHDKNLGECFRCDNCERVMPVAFEWCPFCGHHMKELQS